MAYDAARRRVVLFGGGGSDTWEWDGVTWMNPSPTAMPAARVAHAVAYDAKRGRVVLFGGVRPYPAVGRFADTWEWDGAVWSPRSPSTSPRARSDHALAYDTARERIVLLGGYSGFGHLADTHEWDGTSWHERSPSTTSPAPDSGCVLAHDTARGRTVLYGEASGTWEWNGAAWLERRPATSPPGRYRAAVAYDEARQRLVLFGGSASTGSLADTWEWDGSNWALRTSATSPSARAGHAMAYDAARRRVLLFGGATHLVEHNDTWEWDGTTWTRRAPTTSPSGRAGHALAYDAGRQRVVLFGGGYFLADTWEWDGTTWLRRSSTRSPSGRVSHAMTYDITRQRVVLFGGSETNAIPWPTLADTWEWDGTDWLRLAISTTPAGRAGHAMTYDATRGCIVLFGGYYSGSWFEEGICGDTWLFGAFQPAAAQPIGSPCSGSNGPPQLTSNEPHLGNPAFVLDLLSARPASVCAFLLADRQQTIVLPGGCTVHVGGTPVVLPSVTNASGFATTLLPVPFEPTLRGGVLYAQAATVDPQGPGLGLTLTAGRRLVIGE